MSETNSSLPPLILFDDYGRDWDRYIDAAFAIFYRDFIETQPKLDGKWVRCRRDPMSDGKEAAFWHCVSSESIEDWRRDDFRRIERISWIRFAIEHAGQDNIDRWTNIRYGKTCHLIWVYEEFLVVLEERRWKHEGHEYFQLITAYCTLENHRKRKLRDERNASRNG